MSAHARFTGRMNGGIALLSAGAIALLGSRALAQPILIDFELIPGMVNVLGTPIPPASRLADQYLASHGVRFSSGSAYVPVVVHGQGTPSGTRLIGGSTADGRLTYLQSFPIAAWFFDSTGSQPMTVSVVSVRGDLRTLPGSKTLEAFDVAGGIIGSQTLLDTDPAPLMVSAPGIHRVQMFSSSATVGFDDLRFDVPTLACPVVSAHPTPVAICPAGNTSFSFTVAGAGPIAYSWRKGGVAINTSTNPSAATAMLMLLNISMADVATYTCIATNSCGSVTSTAAMLTLCPADFNCSGSLTINDIFDFLAAWFASDSRSDFNGVNGIGIADIFDFLAAWFAGCP